MDTETRIAQFENMCRADPTNDMAHFSLGGAYAQAGRHDDAARAYLRCVELNPGFSKAYQLAAASLIETGDLDRAADTLTRGYTVAAERGDQMPRHAMADLLRQIGRPVPEVESAADPAAPEGSFVCQRTGRPGTKLPRPPLPGPVGEWIYEHISAETWREWIGQGTKVINELRLDLSRPEDAAAYDQHMREFLGIDEGALRA
ncbi:MAG: tetratricopeptide repeat protein [Planctomycetota bacterium]|nr:MAG: tetratricopeptide repeat protein [Planctomycetota bacterium]